MTPLWIAAVVVALLTLLGIAIYNRLVSLRNEKDNAWSQIDVQLKRRHDLVPRLVETVKGYMRHEQQVLEEVTKARQVAEAARGPAATAAAEGMLGALLGRIFALVEAYPDLKANQNFLALQEELTSTENRIAFARQAYNDAVQSYNTGREVFPANLLAGAFPRAEFFQLETAAERALPGVGFGAG